MAIRMALRRSQRLAASVSHTAILQVERLKQLAYEAAVAELVQAHSQLTVAGR